jgi:hypothetical protein
VVCDALVQLMLRCARSLLLLSATAMASYDQLTSAPGEWAATAAAGVERQLLSAPTAVSRHEVALLRLAPGAALPAAYDGAGLELLVVEGTLQHGGVGIPSPPQTYWRRPAGGHPATTPDGCVLYIRSGPLAGGATDPLLVPASQSGWGAGHGGLRVKSLHSAGGEGTAFVFWPKNEKFLPHQHHGGEEIYILSGTFRDEHGVYPAGSWYRKPHGSRHHPWVEEETLIIVKTGHLHPGNDEL